MIAENNLTLEVSRIRMIECDKAIITLVRGTKLFPRIFRNEADWTLEGSPLRQALGQTSLNPIKFPPFIWTRKNSPSARYKAARNLATSLEKSIEDYPFATHFVVAHSHGGNIALKALEIGNLFGKVHVACLSTPFMHIEARLKDESKNNIIVIGATIALASALQYIRMQISHSYSHTTVNFIIYGSTILITLLSAAIFYLDKTTVHTIAQEISVIVPPSASICIVRSTGDEASAALGSFHLVSWLFTRLTDSLSRFLETLSNARLNKISTTRRTVWKRFIKVASFFIAMFSIAEAGVYLERFSQLFLLMSSTALIIIGFYVLLVITRTFVEHALTIATLILTIALPVPLALIVLVTSLCTIPFGAKSILLGYFYKITTEAVPIGTWKVHQVASKNSSFMEHSTTTTDSSALRALCEWMEGVVSDCAKERSS